MRTALDIVREERQKVDHGYRNTYTTDTRNAVLNERLSVLSWVEELLERETKLKG
jgi:hypothetical protein